MSRAWHRAVAVLAAMVALAALASCNIGVPALYLIDGPPKTEAVYKPKDLPTVVFVDDRATVMPRVALRALLGDSVSSHLMKEGVLKKTISSKDAIAYARARESEKKLLSMDAIGRAVGAEQLIYVEMVRFELADAASSPTPQAVCKVRVVDVIGRERLFPVGDEGDYYPVAVQMKPVNPDVYRSSSTLRALEEQLTGELSVAIAKLFYRHETRETGGNLNPR
jgi:hypothetical protein